MSTSPRFTSALGGPMTSYLALKRALGRRFTRENSILLHLDRFLTAEARRSAQLTAKSFAAWVLTFGHLSPTVRRNWMRIVRNFCLYLRRSRPRCYVPDPCTFPAPHLARRPYIFTHEQVAKILRVASGLRPRHSSPLRPRVFRLAVVLLYTAGLRRGELVRLTLSDYDPKEHTLLIRASKFHKSRLVALSKDAAREMAHYLEARRRLPHDAASPLLVNRHSGLRGYSGASLGHCLRRLFGTAGVRTAQGRVPRVHDVRHTYAVHALLRWYHAGVDVQAKLPALAAAMGHVSIVSTAYYLAFLEPIAEAASERFAQHSRIVIPRLAARGGQ